MAAIDFPNSPTLNQIYTSGDKSWKWDGTVWNSVTKTIQGDPGRFYTSDTAPTFPTLGDGWFNTTNGKMYVFYDNFWVDAAQSIFTSNITDASTTASGLVNTTTQTFAGAKTFTSTISGSISGNAGTVTNGVYTTGDQNIAGVKTFSSTIIGSISGNAGTVTNGVYTTGDQTIAGVKTFTNNISSPNMGSVLISNTTFTSAASVTVSNVFSSSYDAYQLVWYFVQNGSGNTSCNITMTSGGTAATSNWGWNSFVIYGNGTTSVNTSAGNTQGTMTTADATTGALQSASVVINLPAVATRTFVHGHAISTSSGNGGNDCRFLNGWLNTTASYDGFRLSMTPNSMTGWVRVYGLKN